MHQGWRGACVVAAADADDPVTVADTVEAPAAFTASGLQSWLSREA
jgi:hypothetical protein